MERDSKARRGRRSKEQRGHRGEERGGVTLGTPWTQLELDQDIPTMFRVLEGHGVHLSLLAEALLAAWPCQVSVVARCDEPEPGET